MTEALSVVTAAWYAYGAMEAVGRAAQIVEAHKTHPPGAVR